MILDDMILYLHCMILSAPCYLQVWDESRSKFVFVDGANYILQTLKHSETGEELLSVRTLLYPMGPTVNKIVATGMAAGPGPLNPPTVPVRPYADYGPCTAPAGRAAEKNPRCGRSENKAGNQQ